MAYGAPYRRRTRRYRPTTAPRRRSSTVPRKRKTTRTYVRSNALANRRQSRQISTLFKLRYGPLQRNLQVSNTTIIINATQPVVFDSADFTSFRTAPGGQQVTGCNIWQVNNLLAGITSASQFAVTSNANALWAPSNADIVDGGRYKPVFAEYQIEVTGRRDIDDCWVQMDMFTQHHGFQQWNLGGVDAFERIMPRALVNMGNMVNQNELNPSLFKLYKRKRIYLNSQTSLTDSQGATSGVTSTTGNTKYFKFRVAPKKARQQMFTTPQVPGTIDDPNLQTGLGAYGYLQVDPRTPLWVMFSTTDRTSLDGDSLELKIRRHVVWRDINGGTNL